MFDYLTVWFLKTFHRGVCVCVCMCVCVGGGGMGGVPPGAQNLPLICVVSHSPRRKRWRPCTRQLVTFPHLLWHIIEMKGGNHFVWPRSLEIQPRWICSSRPLGPIQDAMVTTVTMVTRPAVTNQRCNIPEASIVYNVRGSIQLCCLILKTNIVEVFIKYIVYPQITAW